MPRLRACGCVVGWQYREVASPAIPPERRLSRPLTQGARTGIPSPKWRVRPQVPVRAPRRPDRPKLERSPFRPPHEWCRCVALLVGSASGIAPSCWRRHCQALQRESPTSATPSWSTRCPCLTSVWEIHNASPSPGDRAIPGSASMRSNRGPEMAPPWRSAGERGTPACQGYGQHECR